MRIKADLIAGLSVSGLLLPEAVAYAAIAGLPASRGILAAVAGGLAYTALGRSRFGIVSATSSSAAILAGLLATLPVDGADRAVVATAATLLCGLFFLTAAAMRLGGLASLIPRPVLHGFAFGIALTIILRQIPALTGIRIEPGGNGTAALLAGLWHAVGQGLAPPRLLSLTLGGAALALYAGLRRIKGLPVALLVLGAGGALSGLTDLGGHGVALVGTVPIGAVWSGWSLSLPGESWLRLAPFVLPLVLILLAESWGTVSALAAAEGERLGANRELAAFGLANLASGLAQGMPVGAGFSASSANAAAGARSRGAAVFSTLALAGWFVWAAHAVALLPMPVLAAVVIGTLTHALHPAPFLRLWRLGRDFWLAIASAVAVLGLGVLDGMLISVALSIGLLLTRIARARITRLGRLGQSHDFVDLMRHSDAVSPPRIGVWRAAEPLFFANADAILEAIRKAFMAEPGLRALVVSLEESFDLDSTSLDALLAFDAQLQAAGVRLQLARVHDHVRDVLSGAGAADLLGRCSYSVDAAVAAVVSPVQKGA